MKRVTSAFLVLLFCCLLFPARVFAGLTEHEIPDLYMRMYLDESAITWTRGEKTAEGFTVYAIQALQESDAYFCALLDNTGGKMEITMGAPPQYFSLHDLSDTELEKLCTGIVIREGEATSDSILQSMVDAETVPFIRLSYRKEYDLATEGYPDPHKEKYITIYNKMWIEITFTNNGNPMAYEQTTDFKWSVSSVEFTKELSRVAVIQAGSKGVGFVPGKMFVVAMIWGGIILLLGTLWLVAIVALRRKKAAQKQREAAFSRPGDAGLEEEPWAELEMQDAASQTLPPSQQWHAPPEDAHSAIGTQPPPPGS